MEREKKSPIVHCLSTWRLFIFSIVQCRLCGKDRLIESSPFPTTPTSLALRTLRLTAWCVFFMALEKALNSRTLPREVLVGSPFERKSIRSERRRVTSLFAWRWHRRLNTQEERWVLLCSGGIIFRSFVRSPSIRDQKIQSFRWSRYPSIKPDKHGSKIILSARRESCPRRDWELQPDSLLFVFLWNQGLNVSRMTIFLAWTFLLSSSGEPLLLSCQATQPILFVCFLSTDQAYCGSCLERERKVL